MIDLSNNKITCEGLAVLLLALRSNSTLKTLILNENDLSSYGNSSAFESFLSTNKSL
jgi:hypothetical protein